jgi:hypothetical protein
VNLVVRPEGAAELDERPTAEVLADVFGDRRTVLINVTTDNGHTIITRVRNDPAATELSPLATQVMLHLTGQHFTLGGETVFTELDTNLAHELLELARD